MIDFSYDRTKQSLTNLKLDISISELAILDSEKSMSAESRVDIEFLGDKKTKAKIEMIMKTSSLP